MNLYIADTHFGHANIMRYDHRPFDNVHEMDEFIIKRWQDRVRPDDDVWFLGDFAMRSHLPMTAYLERLPGKKHLIIGNHDGDLLRDEKAMRMFVSVDQMKMIRDTLNGQSIEIHLCHYPLLEWNKMFHGSWHIYGHIHNSTGDTYQKLKDMDEALNAGCMINGYAPASLRELIQNNEKFKKEH